MPSRDLRDERDDLAPPSGFLPGQQGMAGDKAMLDPAENVEVELGDEPDGLNSPLIEEQADGSTVVDLSGGSQAPSPDSAAFDANLADFMAETDLNNLANDIIEAVQDDLDSRQDWENSYLTGFEQLGLKIEDRAYPFKGACGAVDPLMAEATIRAQATLRGELIPARGPVKVQIVGQRNEMLDMQAQRVQQFMNYYLTEVATEWVPDFDQMLFWLPVAGTTFKKVYQDPYLQRPVSVFVMPSDLIVNYGSSDLATAARITHRLKMSQRDLVWRQMRGIYRNIELMPPEPATDQTESERRLDSLQGTKPETYEGNILDDRQHTIYETKVNLDLVGFEHLGEDGAPSGFPLPYRVTLDYDSRRVLEIRRDWEEGDLTFRRLMNLVQYKFMPGTGFYGIGYAHLLGGYAKTATMAMRIMVDSGMLASFPGGVRKKGVRLENSDILAGPTQFIEIDTGDADIRTALMPFPYKEPSAALLELIRDARNNAAKIAAATDIAVGDGRQDAPVGTTVALLEQATKIQSGVVKRCHVALKEELKLIADLFGTYLPPDQPYPFMTAGGQMAVMRQDFDQRIDVIPVSDPNVTSSAQRVMHAEAVLRTAMQAPPGMINMQEAYRRFLTAMDVDNIEALMPPPQAAFTGDPVSENQMLMTGKPVMARQDQNHQAHIMVHMATLQMPGGAAHIQEHLAMDFRNQIQVAMGGMLPPMGAPLPPEIENEIAVRAAAAMQQIQAQAMPPPGADPKLMVDMAKVQQQAKEAEDKSVAAARKDALEVFKTNTQAALKVGELKNQRDIAKLNALVDVLDNRNRTPADVQSVQEKAQ